MIIRLGEKIDHLYRLSIIAENRDVTAPEHLENRRLGIASRRVQFGCQANLLTDARAYGQGDLIVFVDQCLQRRGKSCAKLDISKNLAETVGSGFPVLIGIWRLKEVETLAIFLPVFASLRPQIYQRVDIGRRQRDRSFAP